METAAHQYWMWMKRREILMKSSSFGDSTTTTTTTTSSWEERAFAEDANGSLNGGGGCVWPPRSYSCSFCKREFRSAQALGGHMNVHRRDRARLKHSLSLQNNSSLNNSSLSLSEPKIIPSHHEILTSTTLSAPSRVSSGLSTQENFITSENTTLVSPTSNNIYTKRFLNISSTSSSVSKPNSFQTLEKNPREDNNQESILSICLLDDHHCDDDDAVETNLSVGLKPSGGRSYGDHQESSTIISCKRTKTAVSTLPANFFISSNHDDPKYRLQMEVLGFRSGSKENNLDLELRLGDPPKVK
ncbi:hypothetical protein ACOSP7_032517 [Xanthoceras sorbifolium]|uniref:C2H2-type domain-containing protein n=1 Tax=Xanthoceras sorbifolium TaxID=99658 RepID=A0ABQ8H4B4_9ROSI|nr:hypothetical protein JRO89_XS14G0072700 [Xanthoceras sorbifolium]